MASSGVVEREHTAAAPGWLIVAAEEVRSLWLEGRALVLLLGLSLLLSFVAYLVATNGELSLLSQNDTLNLAMQVTIAVGAIVPLILAADAISGEREKGTLETLLLTPVPRRQIAAGKLAAALSVWPGALLVGIPYWAVLAKGSVSAGDAIFAAAVAGTLLAIACGCLGLIVSALCASNRSSLSVSLFTFVALLVPTQLPGAALKGWLGNIVDRTNPLNAGAHYIDFIVIDNHSLTQNLDWLISPGVAAVVMLLLAGIVCSGLRLNGGLKE